MWVDRSAKIQDKLTEFTVNYVIPKQEVTQLAVSEFSGMGEDLNLKIFEPARPDLVKPQFKGKYRGKDNFLGASDYQTFY
jgi:hypothetical protein